MKTSLSLCLLTILIVLSSKTQANIYNILDYGAKTNEYSTPAIQKAIDDCNLKGGGTVIVPAGVFITGTIVLKSYVHLQLESGAVLQGSINLEDYIETFRKHGIIFCEDATDVSITGFGTIEARGIEFYDTTQNHVYDEFDKNITRQGQNYMPEGTYFTDGPWKRKPKPGMTITFYHCTNLKLHDFVVKDTPSWAFRLAYCENVDINGLTILNNLMIPNSDGIHCTVSRNVRIANCNIWAGDDAIIVTGFPIDEETPGFNSDEQQRHQYGNKSHFAENYTVSNCHLQSRSAGIRVGYGQHPIRRCIFSNIQIYGSNRGIGIFAHDESDIEDLIFSNIIIESKLHNGQWWGNGEPIHISSVSRFEGLKSGKVKNVRFNNIIATGEQGIIFYGLPGSQLENISINHLSIRIVNGLETLTYGGNFDLRPAADIKKQLFKHDIPAIYAQYVSGLSVKDFTLSWEPGLPEYFTHGIECLHVTSLTLEGNQIQGNPSNSKSKDIKLEATEYQK